MKIIVCIKQVPDPEAPQSCFEINSESLKVEPKGIPPVLSLFDENALEAGLQLKESLQGEAGMTVLSMGKRISDAVLQKALAAGADELVKVEDELFDANTLDARRTSFLLAEAIKNIQDFDIILTGRQAADWNAGQVAVGIAHYLGLPVVTLARKIEATEKGFLIERIITGGYEKVETPRPVVVSVSNEVGELRYPTLKQRKDAKKKPVNSIQTAEIDVDSMPAAPLKLLSLEYPPMRKGLCRLISGATPSEAGKKLAEQLKEDGII